VHPSLAHLHKAVRPYTRKNDRRALWEVASTFLVFVPVSILLYQHRENIAALAIGSVVNALLLVRIFCLAHEAGHAALFTSREANKWVGRFLAFVALVPYTCWQRMHHVHHRHIGKLGDDHEGYLWIITKQEHLALGRWQRAAYRIYHHPMALFAVGPILQFALVYRWPGIARGAADRRSIHTTNLLLAAALLVLHLTLGLGAVALAFVPTYIIAASIGSWLFFIQHVSDDTYWSSDATWDRTGALLRGSTFYDLPALLRWSVANAGYHPLHHLNAGIPCYALRQCWEANSQLFEHCPRLTLRQSVGMFRLRLWDEEQQRMTG
jgi:omega-6 fatty acid desaturase (delta-12 desaturase)